MDGWLNSTAKRNEISSSCTQRPHLRTYGPQWQMLSGANAESPSYQLWHSRSKIVLQIAYSGQRIDICPAKIGIHRIAQIVPARAVRSVQAFRSEEMACFAYSAPTLASQVGVFQRWAATRMKRPLACCRISLHTMHQPGNLLALAFNQVLRARNHKPRPLRSYLL